MHGVLIDMYVCLCVNGNDNMTMMGKKSKHKGLEQVYLIYMGFICKYNEQ